MLLWTFPVLCKFARCPVYCHFVSLSYLAWLAVSVTVLRVCAGGFHGDRCIFSFSVTFISFQIKITCFLHPPLCLRTNKLCLTVSIIIGSKKGEEMKDCSILTDNIWDFFGFSSKISQSNWVNRGLKCVVLVPVLPGVWGNELSSLAPHRHQFYGKQHFIAWQIVMFEMNKMTLLGAGINLSVCPWLDI